MYRRARHGAEDSNAVVQMEVSGRLRRASPTKIISGGDENDLEWVGQPSRDHILLDRPANSDTGIESVRNNVR
jgi:hypothetical protein